MKTGYYASVAILIGIIAGLSLSSCISEPSILENKETKVTEKHNSRGVCRAEPDVINLACETMGTKKTPMRPIYT